MKINGIISFLTIFLLSLSALAVRGKDENNKDDEKKEEKKIPILDLSSLSPGLNQFIFPVDSGNEKFKKEIEENTKKEEEKEEVLEDDSKMIENEKKNNYRLNTTDRLPTPRRKFSIAGTTPRDGSVTLWVEQLKIALAYDDEVKINEVVSSILKTYGNPSPLFVARVAEELILLQETIKEQENFLVKLKLIANLLDKENKLDLLVKKVELYFKLKNAFDTDVELQISELINDVLNKFDSESVDLLRWLIGRLNKLVANNQQTMEESNEQKQFLSNLDLIAILVNSHRKKTKDKENQHKKSLDLLLEEIENIKLSYESVSIDLVMANEQLRELFHIQLKKEYDTASYDSYLEIKQFIDLLKLYSGFNNLETTIDALKEHIIKNYLGEHSSSLINSTNKVKETALTFFNEKKLKEAALIILNQVKTNLEDPLIRFRSKLGEVEIRKIILKSRMSIIEKKNKN